jgi:hypothetical protein
MYHCLGGGGDEKFEQKFSRKHRDCKKESVRFWLDLCGSGLGPATGPFEHSNVPSGSVEDRELCV